MKTSSSSAADFRIRIFSALAHLKCELQRDYERTYPALRQIIHLVLNEEESKAWNLSDFPHLLFPDLVEARIAKLSLQPVDTREHGCAELAPLEAAVA